MRAFLFLLLLLACALASPPGYRTHDQINAAIESGPGRVIEVGRSIRGQRILGALLAFDDGHADTPPTRVILTGNVHGDEVVSREVLMWLIDDLSASPLRGSVEVVIVPSVNPDGFAAGTRRNAAGRDMNRCFPDRCDTQPPHRSADGSEILGRDPSPIFDPLGIGAGGYHREAYQSRWDRPPCDATNAPEVAALMRLHDVYGFDVSFALHGGAFVVSLPWDNKCGDDSVAVFSEGPRYADHVDVAETFVERLANHGGLMRQGFTNGAAWYTLNGGRQDYFLTHGCNISLTIEVSNAKTPPFAAVAAIVANVGPALRAAMERAVEIV